MVPAREGLRRYSFPVFVFTVNGRRSGSSKRRIKTVVIDAIEKFLVVGEVVPAREGLRRSKLFRQSHHDHSRRSGSSKRRIKTLQEKNYNFFLFLSEKWFQQEKD